MSLRGKTIVVGITGGIAAYKMPETVRALVRAEARVHVVLSRAAEEFVTPLTLQTLSGQPVSHSTFDLTSESQMGHIRLADESHAFLIAPATANVIAKLANGLADDLLTTIAVATRAPILVAPAMNVHMYENRIVRENISRLAGLGWTIIEPDTGFLACGYEGQGRLPDADVLVEEVERAVAKQDLAGVRMLVTAGPTWEALDPVRHLGNRSSGKMGYAIARVAHRRGAQVTLVTGPTALIAPRGVEVERVVAARDMEQTVVRHAASADVVVMAAAVGDYRPAEQVQHKIKRSKGALELRLVPNADILSRVSALAGTRLLVGFAAETQNLVANARRKLQEKGVHLMVANDVTKEGAGFDVDTNIVSLIDRTGRVEPLARMSKEEVASAVLDRVQAMREAAQSTRERRLRRR